LAKLFWGKKLLGRSKNSYLEAEKSSFFPKAETEAVLTFFLTKNTLNKI